MEGLSFEQVALQLGISGVLIYAFVKVALVFISNWSKAEEARTKALADGFSALISKVDNHHTNDIQSHTGLATGIAEIRGKLDEAIGWQERTPVGEISRTRTPPQGVPAGYYPPQRPKTSSEK